METTQNKNKSADAQTELLLVTVAEGARRLGVSRSTVYELVAQGKIHLVHIGNSARITITELHRFVGELELETSDLEAIGAAGDAKHQRTPAGQRGDVR